MNQTLPSDVQLTPSEWRTVARHFGELVAQLRDAPPLATLEVSAWAVLGLLLDAWTGGDDRSHAEVAASSGLSTRTVRRALAVLHSAELVVQRRDEAGLFRMVSGPRLIPILRAFARVRAPGVWSRRVLSEVEGPLDAMSTADTTAKPTLDTTSRTTPTTMSTADTVATADTMSKGVRERDFERPAGLAGLIPSNLRGIRVENAPAATAVDTVSSVDTVSPAGGLIKKNKEEDLSSFLMERGPAATTDGVSPTQVDAVTSRRLALQALAELHRRANPGIPLPRTCEATHVRLVEACAAQGVWDAATLEQTHLDAITGAFERSTSGAPTPMFIWGKYFFFLKNAGVGRALRLKPKPRPPRRPPPEEPPAPPEWVAKHISAAGEALDRIPDQARPRASPRRFLPE